MTDIKKTESNLESTGIEIPLLTSKPKKILMGICLGVFVLFLLSNIFWSSPKKEKEIKGNENIELTNYPVPKIQTKSKDKLTDQINTNIITKDAIPDEDGKLQLLRQHAPIQMFSAQTSLVQSQETQSVENPSSDSLGLQQSVPSFIGDRKNETTHALSMDDKTKQVERLKHQDYLLLEGTVIPGLLQTAIHSDLEGNLKAIVIDDIYAAQGKRILIPKGSTLLGHYSGASKQEQSRIMVVWTRILRPDGISIKLQAEGTDEVGQVGLPGKVNHHLLARFGQASLLSLLGAGLTGAQLSTGENYTAGLANNFGAVGRTSLQDSTHIKPTITIKAGTDVAVYVNQDISFYNILR